MFRSIPWTKFRSMTGINIKAWKTKYSSYRTEYGTGNGAKHLFWIIKFCKLCVNRRCVERKLSILNMHKIFCEVRFEYYAIVTSSMLRWPETFRPQSEGPMHVLLVSPILSCLAWNLHIFTRCACSFVTVSSLWILLLSIKWFIFQLFPSVQSCRRNYFLLRAYMSKSKVKCLYCDQC
jgi:hypothetical protein